MLSSTQTYLFSSTDDCLPRVRELIDWPLEAEVLS